MTGNNVIAQRFIGNNQFSFLLKLAVLPFPISQFSRFVVTLSSDPFLIIQTESGSRHLPLVDHNCWTIGRGPHNSIVLPDRRVSREHAVLSCKTGAFHLFDLRSRNGSFVNDKRVGLSVTLQNGDRLMFGQTELEFHAPPAAAPVEPSSNSPKTVLMTQSTETQGEIWRTALTSQQITVIWKPSTVDLTQVINHIEKSKQKLPDLLLIDTRMLRLNPYGFCRWCRDHYPNLKVILTSSARKDISSVERRWAIDQGATDLLPGFQEENLLTGVASVANQIKRVLEVLERQPIEQPSLIPILVSIINHSTGSVKAAKEQNS